MNLYQFRRLLPIILTIAMFALAGFRIACGFTYKAV